MPHGGTKVDHTVLYVIVAGKENIGGRFAAYKYGVIYADTVQLTWECKNVCFGFFLIVSHVINSVCVHLYTGKQKAIFYT